MKSLSDENNFIYKKLINIHRFYTKQFLNVLTGVIRIWTSALLCQSKAYRLRDNHLKANQPVFLIQDVLFLHGFNLKKMSSKQIIHLMDKNTVYLAE